MILKNQVAATAISCIWFRTERASPIGTHSARSAGIDLAARHTSSSAF